MGSATLAIGSVLAAVTVFAGGFVSGRMYYDEGGIPADIVVLRFGVAAALLLPYLLWSVRRLLANPGLGKAVALTLAGGAPFGIAVMTGVAGAPVTHGAGIVPAVALSFGALISIAVLKEPVRRMRLAGIALALGGIALLILPAVTTGGATWWGEAAFIAAGVLWGSFTVGLRVLSLRALDGTALVSVLSIPFLAAYWVWFEPSLPHVPIRATIEHGIYQGIVFQVVAVMLYSRGVGVLGATFGVAAMALMPGIGTLMEWAIFDRVPYWQELGAIAVIAAGVVLVARSSARATSAKPPIRQAE